MGVCKCQCFDGGRANNNKRDDECITNIIPIAILQRQLASQIVLFAIKEKSISSDAVAADKLLGRVIASQKNKI